MPFWPFGTTSSRRHHSSSSSNSNHHHHHSSSHHSRPSYARSLTGSIFSRSSSSYNKRRPRDGYIERLIYKFKHLLRELYYYLRKNPVKVFFLVIMPLISGGALAAIARQLGIRLPSFLTGKGAREMHDRMGGSGGYYGSRGYDARDLSSSSSSSNDLGGSIGTIMNIAKLFI